MSLMGEGLEEGHRRGDESMILTFATDLLASAMYISQASN